MSCHFQEKYLQCIKVLPANHMQVSSAGSYKPGRPFSNAGVSGRKKAKVCDAEGPIKVE